MATSGCEVTVQAFPEKIDKACMKGFLREFEMSLQASRPCIVFDCYRVRHMDKSAINLLLHCLEEVMKCNGDLKLAAIPSEAKMMLELAGVAHLFETFDTNADAVSSFHRLPLHTASQGPAPSGNLPRTAENAA